MKLTRRIAIPHVTTLDCECGGDYRLVQNPRAHFQDEVDPEQPVYFAHQCIKCGKSIWVKNANYPMQSMLFDNDTKEEIGELNEVFDQAFRDKVLQKNATTPVLDSTVQPDE